MSMKWIRKGLIGLLLLVSVFVYATDVSAEDEVETKQATHHAERLMDLVLRDLDIHFVRFSFDSGYRFTYPDAVRGIYLTAHSAGGARFETLLDLLDRTELNSMVIDIKDDHGYLTYRPDEDSPYYDIARNFIGDPEEMMRTLEEHEIYPIARVVVFKDTVLANMRPEWSFIEPNGEVYANNRGESYVNPFVKEVWDYNVDIAKKAAELGFREIQFDYVRFAEGFELRDEDLDYTQGDYADLDMSNTRKRVEAVTDFVAYAREELQPYDVDVSVDIFGYAVTVEETPGIGQNFSMISENVDVISSMIYPSHWTSHFGLDEPDREPYALVDAYSKLENEVLGALDNPPVSRPWIQDFSAPWLYSGPTFEYGPAEVEAQILALNENGINEFLLWNAGNVYTEGVDYTPLN